MNKIIVFLPVFALLFSCGSTEKNAKNEVINYRPFFHYSPPKNWVNDPNGLSYLDGEYHLFYQYNPFGNKWGHMSWGHAVSKDLQNWETFPVALPEFNNADSSQTMIFSGCVVIDSANTSGFFEKGFKKGMVAVYTSNIDKNAKGLAQHQSLAFSADKGRTWTQYKNNPVLDIKLKDFRDPNVIWFPKKKAWIMSVVKPNEYLVQFYESKDLKKWNLLSEFGKTGDTTRIWECPSLIKVPLEGADEEKWVLMVSSGHRQKNYLAVQYFVGDFDGTKFTSQKQNEVFYIDEGKDFYASIPFYNLPENQKNPIIIGWLNDWEYANDVPTDNFKGGFSFPRKLSLITEDGTYHLIQKPIIPEKLTYQTLVLKANELNTPQIIEQKENVYHLNLKIDLKDTKGIVIDLLKNGEEKTVLQFDSETQKLSLDRTKSGNVSFHKRFPSIEEMPVKIQNNQLNLDIFVDNSVIEIFAEGGKKVLTDLVFPTKKGGKIEIYKK